MTAFRRTRHVRTLLLATALAATFVSVALPTPQATAAPPGVDPASVSLTLNAGESSSLSANVTTPEIAPTPDIVFLGDTTGSMRDALANVRSNISDIMSEVLETQPNARFGVAEYKESADGPRVFQVNAPLTADAAEVEDGTQQWLFNLGGGGAPWTDFVNAHFQLATGAMAFREDSTRIVAWFGDAESHDPSLGHTLAQTNAELQAVGARVIAVPIAGTTGGGLDALGQATSITNATDGVLMPGQSPDQVAAAILAGIRAVDVTVTPQPTCDPRLSIAFDPAARTVRSGAVATFSETVAVRGDTPPGSYRCTVDFLVGGVSAGIEQAVTVRVPGTPPPAVLRVGDVSQPEGDTNTTPATFTVSLDAQSTEPVTVNWATRDGSATEPEDYTTQSGVLTFAPGDTSEQVSVPIVGDVVAEPDEQFTVELSGASGATIADGTGTGTIENDDEDPPPPAELRIGDVAVSEGDAGTTPVTLTVSLDRETTEPVTVRWDPIPGTADANDFATAGDTLTIPAGETSAQLTVPVNGDIQVEPNEQFTVRLSAPAGATIADADGIVTIANDDTPGEPERPALRVGDTSVPEGDAGTTPATFTVTLDKPSATPVTAQWTTAVGSADAGDFSPLSGTLTFAPNDTSEQVTIDVTGDRTVENDEVYHLDLTGAAGATIADARGDGGIANDDTDGTPGEVPSARIGDVTQVEGNAGNTPATLTVVLDQEPTEQVTIGWATVADSATTPEDFVQADGTLTFAPGDTSEQITVQTVGDSVFEQNERFSVVLGNAVGADVDDDTGLVNLVNDDEEGGTLPTVSVDDAAIDEGDGGTTPMPFTVRLSEASATPVTVRATVTPDTATAPDDIAAGSTVLTIPPGETSAQVIVPVVGDTVVEPDERFLVTLSSPTGADLGDDEAVGLIRNDDTVVEPPSLSIDDTSVVEGNGGTTQMPVVVRLSEPAPGPVTVRWTTANGTATAPSDYTAGTSVLTFAPGEVTQQFTVPVAGDTRVEPDEAFTITLSSATGAAIGRATATAVIINDDTDSTGTFSCTASALNLLGARPAVANPAGTPCVDDDKTALKVGLNLGLLRVQAAGLTATTDQAPGGVSSSAGLLTTTISTLGLRIEVGAMTSTATASCVAGEPVFSGSSRIAELRVNGVRIPIGTRQVHLPLGIVSLSLNRTVQTADGLVQRAVELRTLVGSVVIGESRVGARDNPC